MSSAIAVVTFLAKDRAASSRVSVATLGAHRVVVCSYCILMY